MSKGKELGRRANRWERSFGPFTLGQLIDVLAVPLLERQVVAEVRSPWAK
jgi:hypothetical protein